MNYYNEWDKGAAAWLRGLIAEGKIPQGHVDERSITDVTPADLKGYNQCHFFAGIGGWPLALSIAGIPSDEPIWTGSCPCQPFSNAGRGDGDADARHLWPAFFGLIEKCRPPKVFGEQVASKLGRLWLSAVRADMETLAYAVGAADLCAAGVGAPHIRQRIYWVADADNYGRQSEHGKTGDTREKMGVRSGLIIGNCRPHGDGLADGGGEGREGGLHRGPDSGWENQYGYLGCNSAANPWAEPSWVYCRDTKYRPVEPGILPLANGVPNRVGQLRGYGNAIVPQVAAAFIKAAC